MNKNSIILGSGDLYITAFNDKTGIPDDATIEVDANNMGRIKGGASLEYKPTIYEVKDDTGYCVKRFITSEEVSFKSGVLTWDLQNMGKIAGGGTYVDGVLTIGGKAGGGLTPYIIRFVHKGDNSTLRITLVGTTENGFSLNFNPDKETVIDAEFTGMKYNDNGNMVIIAETANA